MAAQPSTADDFARRVSSFAAHAVYTPNHAPKGSLKKQNRRFQAALLCKQRQPETTQWRKFSSLKTKMERRRLVAKWLIKQGLLVCQDVGEPPTLHRLQVWQRFQAA